MKDYIEKQRNLMPFNLASEKFLKISTILSLISRTYFFFIVACFYFIE
jgi:hypothetical protein